MCFGDTLGLLGNYMVHCSGLDCGVSYLILAEGREIIFSGLKGFCYYILLGTVEGFSMCWGRTGVNEEGALASSYSSRVGEVRSEWKSGCVHSV